MAADLFSCFENSRNIDIHHADNAIKIKTVMSDKACLHEVAYSTSIDEVKLNSDEITTPAKHYKFNLDLFQKQSILCIENQQSVLVSAHTSAGKTVVAEYAIALSLKNKQRVIYTTPIKALSNQKYRELAEEFKDVGLMTGDVTIEPSASCIVMTTEILRQMLYRGSKLVKEIKWVIFDEIHYMRDKTRGFIWEETIILLPDNVRCIFLSATIPNARQFAEWITHLHNQPCNVVYTEQRPTPLQHYLFSSKHELYMVINENGQFNENNYKAAFTEEDFQLKQDEIIHLIKAVVKQNWTPLIVFQFNRHDCESKALSTSKHFDFNSEEEKMLVNEIFSNAVEILTPSEKSLPHVSSIIPILLKGIAFHHSGLLPLIKEVIEILFGEGLIKVLFATETFSMGLNMPAKSVYFSNITKYDGIRERHISSGEYIQMSGRAGRRGIDDKGIVITQACSSENIKLILTGKADPLYSSFRLTDAMILNLLRQEEINPEYLIFKSFLYFQNYKKIPRKLELLREKKEEYSTTYIENESTVLSYFSIKEELARLHCFIKNKIMKPKLILPFLNRGRLIKIIVDGKEYDWGILLEYDFHEQFKNTKNVITKSNKKSTISLRLLLHVEKCDKNLPNYLPNPYSKNKDCMVWDFVIDFDFIYQISTEVVDVSTINVKNAEKSFLKIINRLKEKYKDGFPLLHPIIDMNIKDSSIIETINTITNLEVELTEHPFHKNPVRIRDQLSDIYHKKRNIHSDVDNLRQEIKNMGGYLEEELQQRKKILQELNYCNEIGVITLKGQVACEFSCDELLLTEIIFHGILNRIPVDHCVAILSCLFFDKDEDVRLDNLSSETLNAINVLIKQISKVCFDAKLLENETDVIHNFKPGLIPVIMAWCKGASFLEICNMTTVYEGNIIRTMRSIDDMLRQMYKAARCIGNIDLEVKFSEGIKRLRRALSEVH